MPPELRTPMSDVESRMQIVPLQDLLSERDDLVQQIAPLRAKFGSFGTWDSLRKIELSKVAALIRVEAAGRQQKITESAIEEASHADPRYVDYVVKATEERAEWIRLESRIEGIQDTIQRGNIVGRFVAAEVHLTP